MLIYVGALVTLSGWTVTYIINERGGGSNAGYVSAGYAGGELYHPCLMVVIRLHIRRERRSSCSSMGDKEGVLQPATYPIRSVVLSFYRLGITVPSICTPSSPSGL